MLLNIYSIMASKSENLFIMNGEWTSLEHVLIASNKFVKDVQKMYSLGL